MKLKFSPSMMLVNLLELRKEMDELTDAGCNSFHIDVMDGNYVPNITLGTMDIMAMNKVARIPLEVHLMVNEPINILDMFNLENVSTIMIHPETCTHLHKTVAGIKKLNKRAGLVLNPGSPLVYISELISEIECVMIMSVDPGFAGQNFIDSTYDKVRRLKALIDSCNKETEILVDGSISIKNIKKLVESGANGFILGTASIFQEGRDFKRNLDLLIEAIK